MVQYSYSFDQIKDGGSPFGSLENPFATDQPFKVGTFVGTFDGSAQVSFRPVNIFGGDGDSNGIIDLAKSVCLNISNILVAVSSPAVVTANPGSSTVSTASPAVTVELISADTASSSKIYALLTENDSLFANSYLSVAGVNFDDDSLLKAYTAVNPDSAAAAAFFDEADRFLGDVTTVLGAVNGALAIGVNPFANGNNPFAGIDNPFVILDGSA